MSQLRLKPGLPPWGRTPASAECRHWSGRAVRWSSCAILLCPKAGSENVVRGEVCSVVTPDDYKSEAEAKLAAEKLIRTLMRR